MSYVHHILSYLIITAGTALTLAQHYSSSPVAPIPNLSQAPHYFTRYGVRIRASYLWYILDRYVRTFQTAGAGLLTKHI